MGGDGRILQPHPKIQIKKKKKIQHLKDHRLPKLIPNLDFLERKKDWLSDLVLVLGKLGIDEPKLDTQVHYLETVRTKSKLRMYVDNQPCLVKVCMTYCQRSPMSKLFCGVPPLKLETGS